MSCAMSQLRESLNQLKACLKHDSGHRHASNVYVFKNLALTRVFLLITINCPTPVQNPVLKHLQIIIIA